MPEIVVELGLYFVLMALLLALGAPGAFSALVGGIVFSVVIWREVQR